jgi:hypothetical protein
MFHFPSEASCNHWDLIAADYDSFKVANFTVAYFYGDQVTFMAGRGPIPRVRAFAQDKFPSDPQDVLEDLAKKFKT